MNRDQFYLAHILECIERINHYIVDGREKFKTDEKTQDAVLRNLELIGASVKRLSAEIKDSLPEVPWKKIAGFRDVLAHDYLGLDLSLIWNIVNRDLAELKKSLVKLIEG